LTFGKADFLTSTTSNCRIQRRNEGVGLARGARPSSNTIASKRVHPIRAATMGGAKLVNALVNVGLAIGSGESSNAIARVLAGTTIHAAAVRGAQLSHAIVNVFTIGSDEANGAIARVFVLAIHATAVGRAGLTSTIINVILAIRTVPSCIARASVGVDTILASPIPTIFPRAIINVGLANGARVPSIAVARELVDAVLAVTMFGARLLRTFVDVGLASGTRVPSIAVARELVVTIRTAAVRGASLANTFVFECSALGSPLCL
jgi:hypothetical protein